MIGRPTGVSAHVGTHGTERHNPNPDFYYQPGGGPLLDLGPYYLTAMIFCLGPIARVTGMASRAFDRRMIENGPRHGEWMPVEVDTHSLSLLEFDSGVIGSMMIFDIWDSETPRFEIYGEEEPSALPILIRFMAPTSFGVRCSTGHATARAGRISRAHKAVIHGRWRVPS